MDDHALELETSRLKQSGHQVMAQGARLGRSIQAGHDVVGLGLIDPDRHLTAPRRVAQQHDRTSAAGIKGDAGHTHLHHGRLRRCIDYDQG